MARPLLGWPIWIGVVADDLEAQRRFYREVLGLEEVDAGPDWVQFELGGRTLEILGRSDVPQYARRRYQVGFAVEDIHEAVAQLAGSGVERISAVEGGPDAGQYWCYFQDPEGNVFEVAQRIAGSAPSGEQ